MVSGEWWLVGGGSGEWWLVSGGSGSSSSGSGE